MVKHRLLWWIMTQLANTIPYSNNSTIWHEAPNLVFSTLHQWWMQQRRTRCSRTTGLKYWNRCANACIYHIPMHVVIMSILSHLSSFFTVTATVHSDVRFGRTCIVAALVLSDIDILSLVLGIQCMLTGVWLDSAHIQIWCNPKLPIIP